jgi:hypothetical protein
MRKSTSILSSFCFFSNISADFAARIKIKDSFKIRMNRAHEICHNILLLVVRKVINHQYLAKFAFFFNPLMLRLSWAVTTCLHLAFKILSCCIPLGPLKGVSFHISGDN